MSEGLVLAVLVFLFVVALCWFILFGYHFVSMLDNAKEGWRPFLYVVGPLAFFATSLLTERGVWHRRWMIISLLAAISSGVVFALVRSQF